MNKPKLYDSVEVIEYDYEKIELGGHKGIIKKAEEYTSQQSGKISLKVSIDTAKDDKQPEYFAEKYRNDSRVDKQWSTSAIKYISLGEDENQVRMLKGFITAWENSNNKTFDWNKDWNQMKETKIGLVFGLEEYIGQDGITKTIEKIRDFRSLDKISDVKIPKVKLADGKTYIEYEEYQKASNINKTSEVEITEDMLPF